ncbi:hypothetical protein J6590_063648, partial [Homalodisca vitripennis]
MTCDDPTTRCGPSAAAAILSCETRNRRSGRGLALRRSFLAFSRFAGYGHTCGCGRIPLP